MFGTSDQSCWLAEACKILLLLLLTETRSREPDSELVNQRGTARVENYTCQSRSEQLSSLLARRVDLPRDLFILHDV